MKNILVTGGTVFVSRYAAEYFAARGNNVFVLNRNSRPQSPNVTLIEGDRRLLGDRLKKFHFDAVLDITAYTREDAEGLATALSEVEDYIFISSSAVYPETLPQPFHEEQKCGPNSIWGTYGVHKLEAEQYLTDCVPQAYILRPPYLYGPMQNVYREPFVFECADKGRPFCIPEDGSMKLQFFHVEDLCRMMEALLEKKPAQRIFNVGNSEAVDIDTWVRLCYEAAGKTPEIVHVGREHSQRSYFSFYDYEYYLDVSRQSELLSDLKPLAEGLKESYEWYRKYPDCVNRKPYLEYIDSRIL